MASKITIRIKPFLSQYVAEVSDTWGNSFYLWQTESKTEEECQQKLDKARESYITDEWLDRCLNRHKNLMSMALSVDCRSIH